MDIGDQAQQAETLLRADALFAARSGAPDNQQLVENGQVVCLDCGEPIPAKRLAAVPGAVRCRACQEAVEG